MDFQNDFVAAWDAFLQAKEQIKIDVKKWQGTLWFDGEHGIIWKFIDVCEKDGFNGTYLVLLRDLTSPELPWWKRKYFNRKRPDKLLSIDEFQESVLKGNLVRLVKERTVK